MNAHFVEALSVPAEELAKRPLSDLKILMTQNKEAADIAKGNLAVLKLAVMERAGVSKPNAPGTLTIMDPKSGKVKITAPKKVSWDQEQLAAIKEKIETDWLEDPAEYMGVKYSVSESAYTGWPTAIKSMFEPARTEDIGSVTVEIVEV